MTSPALPDFETNASGILKSRSMAISPERSIKAEEEANESMDVAPGNKRGSEIASHTPSAGEGPRTSYQAAVEEDDASRMIMDTRASSPLSSASTSIRRAQSAVDSAFDNEDMAESAQQTQSVLPAVQVNEPEDSERDAVTTSAAEALASLRSQPIEHVPVPTSRDAPASTAVCSDSDDSGGLGDLEDSGHSGSPVGEKAPKPEAPLLADKIVEAVSKTARKSFKKGGVAIILDREDLGKTLLLSSKPVAQQSNLLSAAGPAPNKAVHGLSYIFLLDTTEPVPTLRPLDLASAPDVLVEHPTRAATPAVAKKMTRSRTKAKIKTEEGADSASDSREGASPAVSPANRWAAAYRTLFRVIESHAAGGARSRIFDPDASKACDHVQDVVAIAILYDARGPLRNACNESVIRWMSKDHDTLHPAIKDKPVSWLDIGVALELPSVFKEAFVHCVGLLDAFPTNKADFHPAIADAIQDKAAALKQQRREIDFQLRQIAVGERAAGSGDQEKLAYVRDPVAQLVELLFRDWMTQHLEHLPNSGAEFSSADAMDVETATLCDHEGHSDKAPKFCLTLGGFYHCVHQADNSYMAFKHVVETLGKFTYRKFDAQEEKRVRRVLCELKQKAKTLVEPLALSHLTLSTVDELRYLACAKPEDYEYPWKVPGVVAGEDEDEDMDLDW